MVKAYAAGPQGVATGIRGTGGRNWQRLRDYRTGALVTQRWSLVAREHRLFITNYGQALYAADWAHYRELYPDVEAPEPKAVAGGQAQL